MSVEYIDQNPQNNLIYAFKVNGKRIVVRMSDEMYQDSYKGNDSGVMDAIEDALLSNQDKVSPEYDGIRTLAKDPKYILTTQGLINAN